MKNGLLIGVLIAALSLSFGCFIAKYLIAERLPSEIKNDIWRIAYKNDKDGYRLLGSKSDLIKSIRQGCELRVGWGFQRGDKSLEHVSEVTWIRIPDGKDVSVHVDPQVFVGKEGQTEVKEWRVEMNTDGEFEAIWIDRTRDTISRRFPQKHIMTWFVKCPSGDDDKDVDPLYYTKY